MLSKKVFALVDCNSFYCSCERLFRPDLLGKPVGVLSNNDGCFVSRTQELKDLGVKMGEPYFKVKSICDKNNVAVFSANFSLYTNISARIMSSLNRLVPRMEVYSVDEAFLDFTGFEKRGYEASAQEVKSTVERHVGIPVSIGVAPTKVLSKIANYIAKKYPKTKGIVSLMTPEYQERALGLVPIEKVWGIGRQSTKKLQALNIKSAKDFRDFKNQRLIQRTLTKVGRQIQDELRGIQCFDLETTVAQKKEIISSRSFGEPVFKLGALQEAVANYVSLALEKLRMQNSVCSKVEVSIRTNSFKNIEQYSAVESYRFQSHTSDTRKVVKAAFKILEKIYKAGYEYKKASVKISEIQSKNSAQLAFFEAHDGIKSERLMQTMDQVNHQDGPFTLKLAACGVTEKAWKMRQGNKSPRFVTGWSELPKVKCSSLKCKF